MTTTSNNITQTFLRNPFTVKSPEELTREQIVKLFVPAYTKIEIIKERKHTFVWGTRGSGKSMILRYLEPACKTIVHGNLQLFLSRPESFIAIYCPCKEGQLNKSEFRLLPSVPRLIVAEHLINLSVAANIVRCFRDQMPRNILNSEKLMSFPTRLLALFDKASIASSVAHADDLQSRKDAPFDWLDVLFQEELAKVARYLRHIALAPDKSTYEAATTGYHDFLLPMIKLTRALIPDSPAPIYILLDDADHLLPEQQQIVNTWMANRDQRDLCLKVSSRREGYGALQTRDGVTIDEVHDYSTVDVDELYTESKSDYAKKVVLIANRRLDLSLVKTKDINEFLPSDPGQDKLLDEIRKETAEEWRSEGNPGRQSDFVTRYAKARLFQLLKEKKQRRNYAGFEQIVHLSSGVIRDFLEPCYLMFSRLIDAGTAPESIGFIPPNIQDDVLFRYSEEFLVHRFAFLRRASSPDQYPLLSNLETLVASLGKLFYERLHDPSSREARLFSFTVRGQIPNDIAEVLNLGVQHRYFQLRSYSTKEGGGREKWYILNRRLCPAFKLDPTGFEGRISLMPDALRVACQDTDRFVRHRLRLHDAQEGAQTLFDFELEEPSP